MSYFPSDQWGYTIAIVNYTVLEPIPLILLTRLCLNQCDGLQGRLRAEGPTDFFKVWHRMAGKTIVKS